MPSPTLTHGDSSATPSRFRFRRMGLLALLLMIASTPIYAPYVADGGYMYDDWANASSATLQSGWANVGNSSHAPEGVRGTVQIFAAVSGSRVLSGAYSALSWSLLADHQQLNLMWMWLVSIMGVLALTVLLVELGISWPESVVIALFTLLSPWADATHLWVSGSTANINLALFCVGMTLAIRGVRCLADKDMSATRAHVPAMALFFAGSLWAESNVGLIPIVWPWYLRRLGMRTGFKVICMDALAIAPITLVAYLTSNLPRSADGSSASLMSHAGTFLWDMLHMASRMIAPGPGIVALGLLIAFAVSSWLKSGKQVDRYTRKSELELHVPVLAATAALAALMSYLPYLPAGDSYRPLAHGLSNRVNIMAVPAIAILIWALLRMASRRLPMHKRTPVVCSVLGVMAFANSITTIKHSRDFVRAHNAGTRVLDTVLKVAGKRATSSRLYVGGYRYILRDGVPIFASQWDLDSAIKFRTGNRKASAFPTGANVTTLKCTLAETQPISHSYAYSQYARYGAKYGHVAYVDVDAKTIVPINDRATCRSVSRQIVKATKTTSASDS